MNPLDTGEPFSIEMMNPDVGMRTGKNGTRWRFYADITEDLALIFANANLAGMVLEMQGRVTQNHVPVDKATEKEIDAAVEKDGIFLDSQYAKPKGGPISKNAGMLCGEIEANYFAIDKGFSDMKEMIYGRCKIESRAELDHNPDAAFRYKMVKSEYITSCEAVER